MDLTLVSVGPMTICDHDALPQSTSPPSAISSMLVQILMMSIDIMCQNFNYFAWTYTVIFFVIIVALVLFVVSKLTMDQPIPNDQQQHQQRRETKSQTPIRVIPKQNTPSLVEARQEIISLKKLLKAAINNNYAVDQQLHRLGSTSQSLLNSTKQLIEHDNDQKTCL